MCEATTQARESHGEGAEGSQFPGLTQGHKGLTVGGVHQPGGTKHNPQKGIVSGADKAGPELTAALAQLTKPSNKPHKEQVTELHPSRSSKTFIGTEDELAPHKVKAVSPGIPSKTTRLAKKQENRALLFLMEVLGLNQYARHMLYH